MWAEFCNSIKLDTKNDIISRRIKALTIQDKTKIVEVTKLYPLFDRADINIDDEWCERVSKNITEELLDKILSR